MKRIRDVLDPESKKALRLGLLLLSTLVIVGASALVYGNMIYENPLNVGNTNGAATGSGSTTPVGAGLVSAIVILGFLGSVIGLSVFGFLRELSEHKKNPEDSWSSSTAPVSTSPRNGERGEPAKNDTEQ